MMEIHKKKGDYVVPNGEDCEITNEIESDNIS